MEVEKPLDKYEPDQIAQAFDFYVEGEIEQANYMFSEVLKFNPVSAQALYGMGRCLHASGDGEDAIYYLEKLVTLYPNMSEGYNALGLLSIDKEEIEKAELFFGEAIQKDPENIDAQLNYADCLFLKEDFDNGLLTLKTILKNHPEHISTLYKFYEIYLEVEHYEDANVIKTRILELEPEFEFS